MILYRYFREDEHASAFLSGVVSMGTLASYRSSELRDEMGAEVHDQSEGFVAVDDGLARSTKYFANVIRVLCCSTKLSPAFEPDFGSHIVQINDAHRFGELMRAALEAAPYVMVGLDDGLVSYTDQPLSVREYIFMRSQLFTKPERYNWQCEYRYAFVERDELSPQHESSAVLANPIRRELTLNPQDFDGLLERVR